MTASSGTYLNINQDRNDEICKSENFRDGGFLALKSKYATQTHTHHRNTYEAMSVKHVSEEQLFSYNAIGY